MKIFKTAKGAFNYIKRNAETGKEKTLNDAICFGLGIYAYSDLLKKSGIIQGSRDAFAGFNKEEDIYYFIQWLKDCDGFLYVQ